ncbi:hypothetical protein I5G81_gp73 [Mycobacterium phage Shandong1]|uniref:DUF7183 domain-containing protein n=1 Tax=Mycobacterium phage Shandong1 TaxID=1983447 RepID=A0A1X9SH98_9CAUD|nr:hypothetical protein I5G81_gp73 [Mycobacterium phage Shandong1]ARQ95512.1 hypothetical protein [Mycobacterium phage Shandong1]
MPELIELSVAEVERLAEVVRARIMHPSHTPVQAIRAGLAAVNAMRLDELAAPKLAPAPRPAERAKPRKVWALTMSERGSEWLDVDGDRWRWSWARVVWQYKPLAPAPYEELNTDEGWIDCPCDRGQSPSSRYAPFTEAVRP